MTDHELDNLRAYLSQWSRLSESLEDRGVDESFNRGRRYGLNIAICAVEAISKGLTLAVGPDVIERYGKQYERSRS